MITNLLILRKAFKVALAVAGISQREWARRNNIATSYVVNILAGRLASRPLVQKINAFIQEHAQDVKDVCQELDKAA